MLLNQAHLQLFIFRIKPKCLGVKIESNYFNITSTQYGILVKSKMVHTLSVISNVFYTSNNKERVNLYIDKVSENHVVYGNSSTVNNNVFKEVSPNSLCKWGNIDYTIKKVRGICEY